MNAATSRKTFSGPVATSSGKLQVVIGSGSLSPHVKAARTIIGALLEAASPGEVRAVLDGLNPWSFPPGARGIAGFAVFEATHGRVPDAEAVAGMFSTSPERIAEYMAAAPASRAELDAARAVLLASDPAEAFKWERNDGLTEPGFQMVPANPPSMDFSEAGPSATPVYNPRQPPFITPVPKSQVMPEVIPTVPVMHGEGIATMQDLVKHVVGSAHTGQGKVKPRAALWTLAQGLCFTLPPGEASRQLDAALRLWFSENAIPAEQHEALRCHLITKLGEVKQGPSGPVGLLFMAEQKGMAMRPPGEVWPSTSKTRIAAMMRGSTESAPGEGVAVSYGAVAVLLGITKTAAREIFKSLVFDGWLRVVWQGKPGDNRPTRWAWQEVKG